jgi:hypothetical protein
MTLKGSGACGGFYLDEGYTARRDISKDYGPVNDDRIEFQRFTDPTSIMLTKR